LLVARPSATLPSRKPCQKELNAALPAADPSSRIKRFYKAAAVRAEGDAVAVTLDGRAPRTPGGGLLVLPTRRLAKLVADEWIAQGEDVVFASMPTTRLAWSALALANSPELTADAAQRLASFAGSDLLCYFAERPASLVERQQRVWAPVIDWAQAALGVAFNRTSGVVHAAQPPATLARIEALAKGEDAFALAGLLAAAQLFGSAILALAVRHSELAAADAFARSRLDETFEEERWGVDAEAARRTAAMAEEAAMLGRWFAALSPEVQAREAARPLAQLGGADPHAKAPPRRRPR
jgi:chaperone required for assembly of F1-ATPase